MDFQNLDKVDVVLKPKRVMVIVKNNILLRGEMRENPFRVFPFLCVNGVCKLTLTEC